MKNSEEDAPPGAQVQRVMLIIDVSSGKML